MPRKNIFEKIKIRIAADVKTSGIVIIEIITRKHQQNFASVHVTWVIL